MGKLGSKCAFVDRNMNETQHIDQCSSNSCKNFCMQSLLTEPSSANQQLEAQVVATSSMAMIEIAENGEDT